MVLFTIIARVADGLPLAATMQDNEQVRSMMKRHLPVRNRTLLLQLTRHDDGSFTPEDMAEGILKFIC